MSDRPSSEAPLAEDHLAAQFRGFGPLGLLAILVIAAGQLLAPLSAVAVLAWTEISKTPWREIGYVRPRSWIRTLLVGLAFGVAFKLMMKILVMPVLGAGPTNTTYHYLVGNAAALPGAVLMMIVVGGFGEETVFRGYLFERAGKLIGHSLPAKVATVLATALLFASLHAFDQGLAGAEQAVFTGTIFGAIYAATGEIWLVMCAHAAFDLAAVAIIYLGLETPMARLVFG